MKVLLILVLSFLALSEAMPIDLDSLHKPRGHTWATNSNTDPVGQRSIAWIGSEGNHVESRVYLEQSIDVYCNSRYLNTLVISAMANANLTSALSLLRNHLAETEVDEPQDTKQPLAVAIDNAETKVKLVIKRPEIERMQLYVNQSLAKLFEYKPRTVESLLSHMLYYDVTSHLYYVDRGLRMLHYHADLTSHPLDNRIRRDAAKRAEEFSKLVETVVNGKVSLTEFVPLSLLYKPTEMGESAFESRYLIMFLPVTWLGAALFYSACQRRASKSSLKK